MKGNFINIERFHLRLFALLAVLLLVALLVYRSLSSPSLEVTHPVRGPAVQAVYATGTVEASIMLPIASRATARLVELKADEGDTVTKDQVIARLESEDLESALAKLRAIERYAKAEYDRMTALRSRGGISQQEYEKAKSEWEAATNASAQAQAQRSFMDLSAPANGRIIRRDGEIGELIPAAQPVFWLAVTSPLRITAEVDEEDIAQVQASQAVAIRSDAFPGEVFHGKVKSITPKGDPIARSYRVRIDIIGDTPLQIGMTVETNIVIGEAKNALLIPTSAITQGRVWLVQDNKLVEQLVRIGAHGTEKTEVVEGISEDSLVVVHPDSDLRGGKRVHTKNVDSK